MIYLYVFGAIALIILGLWVTIKIQSARLAKETVIAETAKVSTKAVENVVKQQDKTAEAVAVVKESLITENKVEQAKIDAGAPNTMFEKDTF